MTGRDVGAVLASIDGAMDQFGRQLARLAPALTKAAEAFRRLSPHLYWPPESRAASAGRRRMATQMRRVERRAARRARR